MKALLRNVLAVLTGLLAGSVVNMGLILAGSHFIPPPPGVDVSNVESIRANLHLYEPRHFLTPFLAHALGTLAGAGLAVWVAARRRAIVGWIIGVFFLAGGMAAVSMIPAPGWYIALDLGLAYLPMAWLGVRLGYRFRPESIP